MSTSDSLSNSLREVLELEKFLHDFIGALNTRRHKRGEDVTHLVDELGLKLPEAFKGAPITWVGSEEASNIASGHEEQTLVLARPGKADALGFTVGCVKIRGRRYCLECGWIYCRVVIRF